MILQKINEKGERDETNVFFTLITPNQIMIILIGLIHSSVVDTKNGFDREEFITLHTWRLVLHKKVRTRLVFELI
jgi:hypothetical protein